MLENSRHRARGPSKPPKWPWRTRPFWPGYWLARTVVVVEDNGYMIKPVRSHMYAYERRPSGGIDTRV